MSKKEQWKNDVLNSLDDIQRAIPDEILLSQIMEKLPENTLTTAMPQWQLRWAMAAVCLLILLNIYLLSIEDSREKVPPAAVVSVEDTPLLNDYSLYQ